MKNRSLNRQKRICLSMLAAAGVIAALAVPPQASAASCTWNPATGNWSTAGNWSCGIVPGPTDTASIGGAQTATVTGFQSPTAVTNAGTVNITNNSGLTILGTNVNSGGINLQSVGNFTDLGISGAVLLNGSGIVSLSNNTNNRILGVVGPGDSLTIGAGQTIQGAGQIGAGGSLAVVNNGTVIANQTNALTLNTTAGVTNNSVLRGDGATLFIQSTAITQGASGTLNAINGGTVLLGNSSVIGGSFTTASGGVIATQGGTFSNGLSGVTNLGTLNVVNNSGLILDGTLTNNGAINVQSAGNFTDINVNGAQTINGTGIINLSNNTNNRILGANASGDALTIANGVTIQGAGAIGGNGLAVTNNGTVIANQSNALTLNTTAGVTNNSVLRGDGATLFIQSTAITQGASGTLNAINGGTVLLGNSSVTGGSFTTASGGVIATQGGTFSNGLSGVANLGTLNVVNNSGLILDGTLTNNGAINVQSAGNFTDINVNGAQTINGTGTINLSNNTANRILGTGATFTLGSGQTLQGSGSIGAGSANFTFVNTGTVIATQSNPLLINATSGVTNTGTLRADGGTLQLQTTVNSGGGAIEARNGSQVQLLNGAVINNASFSASGVGSLITTTGGGLVTLGGGTVSGPLTVANNSALRLTADVNYNGILSLASAGNFTDLQLSGARTLSGAATVQLSNNPANRILGANASGDSFTIANGVTIQGSGTIGGNDLTIINNGTVIANQSNPLIIQTGAGVTNNSVMRADAASLTIAGTNVTQGAAGTLNAINGGTVSLIGNSTITGGIFSTASGGQVAVISGNTAGLSGVNNTGTLNIQNNAQLNLNGTLTNNGVVNIQSAGNFTDMVSTGNRLIDGTGTINLSNNPNNRIYAGSSGNSLTLGSGQTLQGAGQIGAGTQFNLTNNGTMIGNVSNALVFSSTGTVTNNNIVRADGGTVVISATSFGQGASGVINAINGGVVEISGNATVTGGTFTSASGGQIRTLGGNVATIANVTNNGTFNVVNNSTLNLSGTITNNGALNVNSAGNLTDVQIVGNATLGGSGSTTLSNNPNNRIFAASPGNQLTIGAGQTLQGSGQLGANTNLNIVNQGTITANQSNALNVLVSGGTVQNQAGGLMQATTGTLNLSNVIANSGTIAANGGVVNANAGFTGTGTASTSGAGQLNVGAASTVGTLINNGSGASALNLGLNNITVSSDYTNASSGTGNSFNRRANVAGTGLILAGGNAAQAITGTNVTNGNTTNATLTINNVRVGATTFDYQIANTGSTGPSLRGAIQTNVNGANLTDSRLSGAGVTASNYNTGAPGSDTGNLGVTFTAASAGALAPLSGQALNLRSNFDNIADQKLNIVLGAGAAAYNAAVGNASSPVTVANQRIGGSNTALVTVANTAAAGSFSEDLIASIGGSSGAASGSGSITGRLAGTNNTGSGVISVAVDTSTAGAKAGTVTLAYQTAGAVNGVSNGLGVASVGSQIINVSGDVYRLAQGAATPAPINFGNRHVGDAASQVLTVQNTAANDGFSEKLNANFGTTTGAATNNAGSVGLLVAGGSNNTNMTVGLDTSSAGARSGTVAVDYQSDGAGTSGLAAIAAGSQTVNVSGNVYRLAQANSIAPINFGNVLVGSSQTQTVSISNLATADGFSEALNAAFGTIGGANPGQFSAAGFINQLAAGANNNANMIVTLNTSSAGTYSANVQILLNSDGTGTSGLGITALPTQVINLDGVVTGTVGNLAQAGPHSPEPVNFGNVRVGTVVPTQALSISNTASGPAEGLNGSISTGSAGITASGAFSNLAAGATDNSSLLVGINTATAGSRNGTATIALASDGTFNGGTQTTLSSQTVNVQGGVFQMAQPAVPANVNLGNVRIGGSPTQAITIGNTDISPAGFQEGLNASVGGTSGGATGTGSITTLAAGSTSNAIDVGLNVGGAGAQSGTVTLNLASNGTVSGLSDLALADANVNVQATGYRLADPVINTGSITLAARVGDASPSAGISVTNTSPDSFTEGLNVTRGSTTPADFTSSGSISNLAAGTTDSSAIQVALNTSTAGTFTGTQGLNFVSTGAGTTGAADISVGTGNVNLNGKVYTPAQASVGTTSINFGIVHVGDVVAAQTVSLANSAPATALNDTLSGSLGGASAPFSAGGSVSGLTAGGPANNTSLQVGLNTSTAGIFTDNGTLMLASQNPDMPDLALADVSIDLNAQVNNYADAALRKNSGSGSFTGGGNLFVLDFGTVVFGSGAFTSILEAFNSAFGPADLLDGIFSFLDTQDFTYTGFGSFNNLAAGQGNGGMSVGFNPMALGSFSDDIQLASLGHNASGYSDALQDIQLRVQGNVVAGSPGTVPEPGTWALLALGCFMLTLMRMRRGVR